MRHDRAMCNSPDKLSIARVRLRRYNDNLTTNSLSRYDNGNSDSLRQLAMVQTASWMVVAAPDVLSQIFAHRYARATILCTEKLLSLGNCVRAVETREASIRKQVSVQPAKMQRQVKHAV